MKSIDFSVDFKSRDELYEIQGKLLVELVERVYNNVAFYKRKMMEMGIEPGDIQNADDIVKLPFTTKDDLRDNYPYGLFAVPNNEVVRIHASSGTTGKPTVVGYTQGDIDNWASLIARCLSGVGLSNADTLQVAYGYGLFTGGLGLHYGAEALGATVIPLSGGNTAKQMLSITDFLPTAIACTPSYAQYLGEALHEQGLIDQSRLKVGILGAEPWTEEMRKNIENKLRIKAYDIYGLSEVMGPGVACECTEQAGLHIFEDHFLPEVLDVDTLKPTEGRGELVFTTLTKEALPLLRYRTKDIISELNKERCGCGRTHVRMNKPSGRSDDMLIIRGVNVFPSQIEEAMLKVSGISSHYMLIVDRQNNLDTLELMVEVENNAQFDEIKELEKLSGKIRQSVESIIGISIKVRLVEHKTVERFEGKSARVIDKRKI